MKRTAIKTFVLSSSCIALMLASGAAMAAPDAAPAPAVSTPASAPTAPMVGGDTAAVTPATPSLSVTDNAPPMATAASMDAATPQAAPTQPHNLDSKIMNLRDVVAVGLRDNPEYGIVANNRRATDEELNQAVDLYFPSVDFHTDAGYEISNNPVTRTTNDHGSEDLWRYNSSLTLTQMMFDGWSTSYENERQKFRVLSASHRVREAAELTSLSIVESYLEVMRQRELLKIARDNVDQHSNLLQQIEDSSRAGRTTQADAEQARARLASARSEEASIRESLRSSEAGFMQQVGDVPRDLIMPVVPADALEPNLEQEVRISQYQSPTIAIKQADYDVAHAEIDKAKAPLYPKVDFQVSGRTGDNLSGIEGQDSAASAEVVLDWNLYRGGGDIARIREAINREAQAKADRMQSMRQVDNDVRQTWARMVSAGERARQFASQADADIEVVKAYKDQFDLNRRTLLDVLDAQNESFVSRSNMINAEYVEIFAIYRLLALKGELLKTLGVELPREADPNVMLKRHGF